MTKAQPMGDWRKICEFRDMTSEALILGFTEPIWRDFCIPRGHIIEQSVVYAAKQLFLPEKSRPDTGEHGVSYYFDLNVKRFILRVENGIVETLHHHTRDDESSLEAHIHALRAMGILGYEFITFRGDIFQLRDDERKKMEERVQAYWKPEEFQNFLDLHVPMRKYTKLYYGRKTPAD